MIQTDISNDKSNSQQVSIQIYEAVILDKSR
jgi:hypothetical protein